MATRTRPPKTGVNKAPHKIVEARTRGINTGTYEGAAMIDVNKPLTDKQKLFVKYWAEGESILTASYKAGYADGGTLAYRLTKMPNIIAAREKYAKQYEEESKMSRKKVMDMHMEAFEMAKLLSEPASMVSAAREIGKLCGYYEPTKREININVNGTVTMQQMAKLSDAELVKIIEEGLHETPEIGFEGDEDGPDADE